MSSTFTSWPFWQAGAAIGLFVVGMLALTGKTLGVSSGYGALCGTLGSRLALFRRGPCAESWRLYFTLGIPLGALFGALHSHNFHWGWSVPGYAIRSPLNALVALFLGGVLIGYGARWAGGCTSGHSIVGIAKGSKSSVVVTMGFMAAGFIVTYFLFRGGR